MISTRARSGSTLGEVTDSAWDEISQTIAAAPYPVTDLAHDMARQLGEHEGPFQIRITP